MWAETLRDGELSKVPNEGYAKVRERWVRLVERCRDAGMTRADVPAGSVARTVIAAAQGFIAQMALFGNAPVEVLQEGLRGLMSLGGPAPRDPGGSQAG
ncbi:TetR family transcriptional regulator C-terminal domain-containing protein [Streptomyces sp. QTS52]